MGVLFRMQWGSYLIFRLDSEVNPYCSPPLTHFLTPSSPPTPVNYCTVPIKEDRKKLYSVSYRMLADIQV